MRTLFPASPQDDGRGALTRIKATASVLRVSTFLLYFIKGAIWLATTGFRATAVAAISL